MYKAPRRRHYQVSCAAFCFLFRFNTSGRFMKQLTILGSTGSIG
ncbi:1-deoxy-D-xylulose-5-phosphate reductoisomerase, partial [Salmonella enterica subsp. enterica serovar Typhi]|nr:1-deoxy-D-xylulose-5-phosphate reductoisomerase [Salmonella enterica subsp. enterica serovar Typhi]